MGYLLVSASPGGGGGGESETENSEANIDGRADDGGQSSSQDTQQSEPLTPVYLGEDMIRVWFISVGLSMMAGLYPAWKASRYLPVDALRSL